MKSNFIHLKEDNKKIIMKYLVVFGVLLVFGMYKNGVFLYQHGFISVWEIFKPLLFSLISFFMIGVKQLVFNKKIELDYDYDDAFILSFFVPARMPLSLYAVFLLLGLVLSNFLEKVKSFNVIAFLKLVLVLGLVLSDRYNYQNLAEASGEFVFNTLDYFCGMGVGGVSSSCIIIGILIYFVFSIDKFYKKRIPIISYGVYLALLLPFLLRGEKLGLEFVCSSSVIMAFILVAPNTLSSPYTKEGQIIYGICSGILSVIFSYFWLNDGVFVAIFITSLGTKIFDKIGYICGKIGRKARNWQKIKEIKG